MDLDSTSWSATVDYGDGTPLQVLDLSSQRTFELSHIYGTASPTNAPFNATVRIVDNGGRESVLAIPVTVQNQAPVNSFNQIVFDQTIDEGGTVTLSGSFEDTSDSETHRIVIKWGDGSESSQVLAAGLRNFTDTHVYPDDGTSNTSRDNYRIEVTVIDESNGTSSSPFGLILTEIRNVKPQNVLLNNDPIAVGGLTVNTVAEGTQFTFSGTFDDPGLKDNHELIIDWGDGSPVQSLVLNAQPNQTLTRNFSFTHTYVNNPLSPQTKYQVSLDIRDDDEPTSPTNLTREITVTNALPVINSLALTNLAGLPLVNNSITENESVRLAINYSDAGLLDSHRLLVNWGDGSEPLEIKPAAGTTLIQNLVHQYRDNAPGGLPYQITVSIADEDMPANTFVTQSVQLNVLNNVPTASDTQLFIRDALGNWIPAPSGVMIDEGSQIRVIGTYSDASALDRHTVTVQWAPGQVTEANVDQFTRTYEAIFTYLDDYTPGTAQDLMGITVTVADDDGGVAQKNAQVIVKNVAPTVVYVPDSWWILT